MKYCLLSLALILVALPAFAGWPAVDGQLVDEFGDPNLSTNVGFRVQIFDEGSDCLLSTETFINGGNGYDLSKTRGSFSLGLSLGSAQTFHGANANYTDIFAADPSGAGNTCTEVIAAGERREFMVSYSTDGGVTWNGIGTPMIYGGAASAATLNGLTETDFVTANTNTSQVNLDTLTALHYPTSPAPPLTDNEVLTVVSGVPTWQAPAPSGGITSINLGPALGNRTVTASGDTITLSAPGTSVGSYGDAMNIPQIDVDASGRITSVAAIPISENDPGLQTLSATQIDQLENIGGNTISTTNWNNLAALTSPAIMTNDNLGNHIANTTLKLNNNLLSNNGMGGLTLADNTGNANFSGDLNAAGSTTLASLSAADIDVSGSLQAADGGETNPAFAFSSNPLTGMYLPTGGGVALSVGGVNQLTLQGNGGITMEQNGGAPGPANCNTATVGLVKHFAFGSFYCFDDGVGGYHWVPLGAGPTKCSGAFLSVGDPGKSSTFCVENTTRLENSYAAAVAACAGASSSPRGNPRLCNYQEMVLACQELPGALSSLGQVASANPIAGNFSKGVDFSNCNASTNISSTSSANYLCCID